MNTQVQNLNTNLSNGFRDLNKYGFSITKSKDGTINIIPRSVFYYNLYHYTAIAKTRLGYVVADILDYIDNFN